MTAQQVNPTAKERFQSVEANIKGHHALIENPAFDRAEDAAMLSYNRSLAKELLESTNPQFTAAANAWKLVGVQEFMNVFRTLAEKPVEVKPPGVGRVLDHKA